MTDDRSRRIGALSPEKRALLEKHLLRSERTEPDEALRVRRPGDPAPLSFSQQRLWFLDQWSPGDPTYNAAIAFRLRGEVDAGRLETAFRLVVGRHEAVRTVFRSSHGTPEQVVLDDWSFELSQVELAEGRPDARSAALRDRLRREARRPFDLTRDLTLRATLFRLAPDEACLLIVEHHIAFDGWSDAILFAELAEGYAALGEGRPPRLPDLPVQYADFALWQRRRLTGARLDRLVAYWLEQLKGAPPQIALPTDRPRPPVQAFAGAHHHFTVGAEPAAAVSALARSESATPYMTLLAAFAAALYRWAGCADVCIGTPTANRGAVELEPLIGFFSNTLVLRVRTDPELTFRQLVRRVRENALGAYEHQDLPFEKVVEQLAPPRDPGRNPLFQVNFRVRSGPPDRLRLPGVQAEPVPLDVGFSRFDLALELQVNDGLSGYLEYNLALFEPQTAQLFAKRFSDLLRDALDRPDAALAELVFGGNAERPAGLRGSRRARAPR